MAVIMDGIYVNGQKATFRPEDILSDDASAYTEEIGTAVEAWMEENVTGGEQVTDTTLTLPGVPADSKTVGDQLSGLKEELTTVSDYAINGIAVVPASCIVQGAIAGTGANAVSATRIRTSLFFPVKKGSAFAFIAGTTTTHIYWYLYLDNGTVQHASDWLEDGASITFNSSGYLRFMFRKSDSTANISPGDYDASVNVLTANHNMFASFEDETNGKISALSKASITLYDGYIASTTGAVVAPTSDKQKYSDYIPVTYLTTIKATVTFNGSHYRQIGIMGYDTDKGYVSRLDGAGGGVYHAYDISCRNTNPSVKYVRLTLNGYDDLLSVDVDTYANGSEIIKDVDSKIVSATTPIYAEIDTVKDLDGIRFQYIDKDRWENGYYYNYVTQLAKNTAGSNWNAIAISGLYAGTYHFNKFCSIPFSWIEKISTGEIENLADIGVTETANGTVTINYDFNLYLTINETYFDKTKAMFADGNLPSEYVYGLYKSTNANTYYVNAQGQTVWIVGEGYIPTIQQACDMASANDIIFIRCGTYTEQVSIWNKKLHLIGENKANTILIDHSGAYNTPPLEMSLGSLSNMTIIEDGSQPTLNPGESGYNGAYCLHIEWTPPANEVFKIDNCDFINYVHSPLGCGLYQDYTVHFKDCTFRCEAANEGNMERGSFYFHSNIQPNVTGQKIIAENCIISSAGQKWAVLLGVPTGVNNTGSAEARFSGCTIWNDNLGTVDSIAYFDKSGGADVLKVVHSCGNTVDILNNW